MAATGSFNTTGYSNRYLTFSWSTVGRSIEHNYTTIYWELKGAGSHSEWFKTGPITLVIDGEIVYNSNDRIQLDNGTLVAYGSKTIYHNSDGSRHFSASASAAIYSGSVNCDGSAGWDLDAIPRQAKIQENGAPNFTDMDNPTVYFDNPAGSAVTVSACISWTGGDDIAYRDLTAYERNNGYYTFYFAEEERNKLRAATTYSTSRYVTFYITTWIGNNVYYSTKQVTFTVTDCVPDINPTVIDKGTVSTGLTGNQNTMIRGYNTMYASFNPTLKKGASIASQTVTCGGKTLYGDGFFEYVYDNTFVFTLTDSRGQTVSKTITVPAIDYISLTCNISYETSLKSDNTADINVTISGDHFNGSFGYATNGIELQYAYCKKGELYSWTIFENPVLSNNTYTATFSIKNAHYTDTYYITAWVKDGINGGIYAKEQTVKVQPVFDWGEHDFNFNVPVSIMGNYVHTLNGISQVCRAYTQETDISYAANSYIKLFRDGSPTDLHNVDLVGFANNGTIYIKKDMLALVNVHIVSQNPSGRSWIRLMNYDANWKYTDCITYGDFTTSQITTILNLKQGTTLGIVTVEAMNINASGLAGSYIEIYHL